MNGASLISSLSWAPDLPVTWLWGAAFFGLAFVLIAILMRTGRMALCRFLALASILAVLLSPAFLQETRKPVSRVAVALLDESPSQTFGQRQARSEAALETLKQRYSNRDHLELRVIRAPQAGDLAQETRIFDALTQAFSDVPPARRAGAVLITDGQVHDIPDARRAEDFGPLTVLLSGERSEIDRRIEITQAPPYGIVGESVTLGFQITDTGRQTPQPVRVQIRKPDGRRDQLYLPEEQITEIDIPITHSGDNIVEIKVESLDGELTTINNRALHTIRGIRDRLRVLLVSGKPHNGGRMWRDLLTADPGVDLVHFTILREPTKLDATPRDELSLIAFPFRELFELKLNEFDLIVFDQYRLSRILPPHYFQNIAEYVMNGGALLEASGPDFATDKSVYSTALNQVLPGEPTGRVLETPFYPRHSDLGRQHPVSAPLAPMTAPEEQPEWGQWFRQIEIRVANGDVLMEGPENLPLIVVERTGEGRVAQISSDQLWLWRRGHDGGGPYASLLRRVIHWLMKEPDLDEQALDVRVRGERIRVRVLDYPGAPGEVSLEMPDGETRILELKPSQDQWLQAEIKAEQLGAYVLEDPRGNRRTVSVGGENPEEYQTLTASAAPLTPLVQATDGDIFWLADGFPAFLPLNDRPASELTGVREKPALPPWIWAILLCGVFIFGWWREGR